MKQITNYPVWIEEEAEAIIRTVLRAPQAETSLVTKAATR